MYTKYTNEKTVVSADKLIGVHSSAMCIQSTPQVHLSKLVENDSKFGDVRGVHEVQK